MHYFVSSIRKTLAALLLFAILACASRVDAVPFPASKDNTLYQSTNGTLSNGQGIFVFAGRTNETTNPLRRGVIAFDLSSIPPNATILSASLNLFLVKMGPVAPGNITVNRALRNWGEGNSNAGSPGGHGATAQTNDTTWLHNFFNTGFWTTPGGDFLATPSATAFVEEEGRYHVWSSAGLIADVQTWVSNPANNFGWFIIGNEINPGSAAKFATSENGTNPPRLDVTFTTSPPTPTPSATATATPTATAAATPTSTPTPAPTITPSPTPVSTPTPAPTLTPGITPTPTAPATASPFPTPSISPTPGASVTPTPAISATPTPAVSATPSPGATSSPTPMVTPTPTPPVKALNISTRMRVGTGTNVLIGGFIVTGTASKNVAIRGVGPSLAQFGIPGVLADPTLQLRDNSGALVMANDNWQDDPVQAAQLTALDLALQDPNESGIVASLSPSAYTAILAGTNGGTGIGLMEIYDTNPGADSQLANISTRGLVLNGSNVMIGGFILGGSTTTQIAVRGIGPSLAQIGLSPVLADPTLELRDSNGALLISNDNWQDDPISAFQLFSRGLALPNPNESGIYASLPPGAFTAILAGRDGGTGIGLVEIYNLR